MAMPHPDASMELQNLVGPFVTQTFAQRLAVLVLEERYTANVFLPKTPVVAVDKGELWSVTVENALSLEPGLIRPKDITVQIRKRNGEIVAIGNVKRVGGAALPPT
jgi:hypothetical protein